MTKCEIISIGDELLIGQVVNTNSSWIAMEVSKLGVDISTVLTIGDTEEAIMSALKDSYASNDITIVTGGLGPTNDDITKDCACKFFDSRLILNEPAYQNIVERFEMLGFQLTKANKLQAMVPDKCIPLPNQKGTAPGMLFKETINGKEKIVVFLPGVPAEMKYLMQLYVLPLVKSCYNLRGVYFKTVLTQGKGESFVAEVIKDWESNLPANVRLAYLPKYGSVKLRVTAYGSDREENEQIVENEVAKLSALIPDIIYGYDDDTLEQAIGVLLREKSLTLSTAESCTGGRIAEMITSVPNCSQYFKGSLVAYYVETKTKVLGVRQDSIDNYGVVSKEVVEEMAKKANKLMNTNIAIATTGMAGPTSSEEHIMIGNIWIAIADNDFVVSKEFNFGNNREINIQKASDTALKMLYDYLKNK